MNDSNLLDVGERLFPSGLIPSIAGFLIYTGLLCLIMRLKMGLKRQICLLVINLAAVAWLAAPAKDGLISADAYLSVMPGLAAYLITVCSIYFLTRLLAFGKHWWIPAMMPIAILILLRYGPQPIQVSTIAWIGFSYMAFRLSQLVVIVRSNITEMPSILDYLNFAFFAPTILAGPINAYSTFQKSYYQPDTQTTPPFHCLMRILIGSCKLLFLGSVLNRLTYKGLLMDFHPHPPVDLVVSAVAYYLYLYCNFSGYCDVAIGASGLAGIKVSENFNNPFAARNIQDFWNRWHITLSSFMRDMCFNPLCKALIARMPISMAPHAIALTICIVFTLIGMWHGRDPHFVAYGAVHALGVVTNHYYGLALKKYLSKDQLRRYNSSNLVRYICIAATFIFVTSSLSLLANTFMELFTILYLIRT
ncbi:MAG: hypothetical protein K2Y39_19715 [Candidatus Obscuribacterales bacterium]|nr:hypothetical protein [Candidatus Obscuribacterales bacterium]